MPEVVREEENGIVTLTLDEPAVMNAMSRSFPEVLGRHLVEINTSTNVRAIILTGVQDVFCAGAQVGDVIVDRPVDRNEERDIIRSFNHLVEQLRRLDIPTIAAVNGVAVGGGVALALACDLVVAAAKARFLMGFARVGLSAADMGLTYILPRLVGLARATRMLLLSEEVSGTEAEAIGMIARSVPKDRLMTVARSWAESFVVGAPLAATLTKLALTRETCTDFSSALEMEVYLQSYAMQSEDHKEGVRALREKRETYYKGR